MVYEITFKPSFSTVIIPSLWNTLNQAILARISLSIFNILMIIVQNCHCRK